jgi:hypothetical protein
MESRHVCLNCGHSFTGKFCNECGEKIYNNHDKSVLHLFEEAFHFVTHFEGKFFNTLKVVLFKPGKLSVDYCNGIRKKYFKPISFFLFLVILYLIFPVFSGLNQRLEYHKMHEVYGDYATAKMEQFQAEKKIPEERANELYHLKSEKTSKFLLFTIIPCLALVSWGAGFWKRRYYFDHFIFSIEVLSVLILGVFLLFPLILNLLFLFRLTPGITEGQTGIGGAIILLAYYIPMTWRFFKFKWWYNIVFTLILIAGLLMIIQYIYRFLLFYITFKLL